MGAGNKVVFLQLSISAGGAPSEEVQGGKDETFRDASGVRMRQGNLAVVSYKDVSHWYDISPGKSWQNWTVLNVLQT